MAEKKRAEEPEERPSRAAGGCVLVVLAGGLVAVAFAVDEAAGVLLVVVVGVVALWRSARRKGTDLALPSPTERPPRNDVSADELRKAARAAYDPNGVMCIVHAREDGSHETS
ncbi:hypothetical protein [Streptomyces caniscabiei]|uniref:hypothetical protein n=1 Tax=Streptomyces caniscabiei TaxID=2746961 RepID=UPI000A3AFD17|nr:hypothetical protein [Streptomyces caniscabiei]